LELAKESASVYNQALDLFWQNLDNDIFLSKFDLQKYVDVPRKLLHSDAYLGALQLAHTAISTYFSALKVYKETPDAFTGQPMPPKEHKNTQMIIFKKSAIRYKENYLLLSTGDRNNPLKFRWNINNGLPVYATITWNKESGWQLNLILEKEQNIHEFVNDKLMAIDLGVKRIATLFDENQVITMSGKLVMSLNRLRNKVNAETQNKLSRLDKHSRQYKKIRRANRKVVKRVKNKIKDILHKYSRTIVNHCVENNIGKIVVGDCSDIHNGTNLGKENNQKVQQSSEQKLLHYVKYKFEDIGGTVEKVSEAYTSRTCPMCGNVLKNTPNSRVFKCCQCSFEYDRDGVGAINIHKKVSFGQRSCLDAKKVSFGQRSCLDVVGGLTPPIGLKYHSNRDCLVAV
jgi:putative transposase